MKQKNSFFLYLIFFTGFTSSAQSSGSENSRGKNMESLAYLIGHWEGKVVAYTNTRGDTFSVKKDVTRLNDTTIEISTEGDGLPGPFKYSENISFNKGSNQYEVTVHGNKSQFTSALEIPDDHSIEYTHGSKKNVIKVQNDQWTEVQERDKELLIEAHLERKK
jgi:hypothetical protein